jgi:hypothetical protein
MKTEWGSNGESRWQWESHTELIYCAGVVDQEIGKSPFHLSPEGGGTAGLSSSPSLSAHCVGGWQIVPRPNLKTRCVFHGGWGVHGSPDIRKVFVGITQAHLLYALCHLRSPRRNQDLSANIAGGDVCLKKSPKQISIQNSNWNKYRHLKNRFRNSQKEKVF